MRQFRSFREFWPYYLQEHARPWTRGLHYLGTGFVLIILVIAMLENRAWPLLMLPVAGYGFAWSAHFLIERNRPATFRYPSWSFVADFWMLFRFLTRQIAGDLVLAGVRPDGTVDPALRL